MWFSLGGTAGSVDELEEHFFSHGAEAAESLDSFDLSFLELVLLQCHQVAGKPAGLTQAMGPLAIVEMTRCQVQTNLAWGFLTRWSGMEGQSSSPLGSFRVLLGSCHSMIAAVMRMMGYLAFDAFFLNALF